MNKNQTCRQPLCNKSIENINLVNLVLNRSSNLNFCLIYRHLANQLTGSHISKNQQVISVQFTSSVTTGEFQLIKAHFKLELGISMSKVREMEHLFQLSSMQSRYF